MKTLMFSSHETVTCISEKYHYTGSKGVFCLGPFLFMAILIDYREGRRGCGPWQSIPRQFKVLSKASQPKKEVLYQVNKTGTHLLVLS